MLGDFAAEFQAHLFQVSRSGAHDELAHLGGPSERDFVHAVMRSQGRASSFAETGDDIDHAFRQAGFEQNFAQPQRERAAFVQAGLSDDAIATGQCRTRVSMQP